MKKLALLFLAMMLVLISLVIGGCGGATKGANSEKESQPSAKVETAKELLLRGQSHSGLSYDCSISVNGANKVSSKVWVADKQNRTEMSKDGEKIVSIIDEKANIAYTYMPDQKTAYKHKIDLTEDHDSGMTSEQYTKDVDDTNIKVLETTTYDGVKCKVLQIKDKDSSPIKMWVREDYGVPVRMEIKDPDGDAVVEYKNIKVGTIPANMFTLPAGINIINM